MKYRVFHLKTGIKHATGKEHGDDKCAQIWY